jgi:tRNA pseudouridine38-40 synthase
VARRAATRTYLYRLRMSPVKAVRDRAYVWSVRGAVDTALLGRAAALLPGRRDFSALTPSAHLYRTCVREVLAARWAPASSTEWTFSVTAGSFLHNMVRVAVGSMVDVAQGRMTLDEYAERLAAGERREMGQTAPARGLALVAVTY